MRPTARELDLLPQYSVVCATFMKDETRGLRRTLVRIGWANQTRWLAVGCPDAQWDSAGLVDAARDIEIMR